MNVGVRVTVPAHASIGNDIEGGVLVRVARLVFEAVLVRVARLFFGVLNIGISLALVLVVPHDVGVLCVLRLECVLCRLIFGK